MRVPIDHRDDAADEGPEDIAGLLAEIDAALDDLRLWRLLGYILLLFGLPLVLLALGVGSGGHGGSATLLLGAVGAIGSAAVLLRQLKEKRSDLESKRAFHVEFSRPDERVGDLPEASPTSDTHDATGLIEG